MDEKICKLFLPLLEKLYNQEPAGEPFRKPVDVVKYGCIDYYLYIKHPIDLTTIRERLTNHKYQGDAWRFIADIQLLFSNAYLFNKRGTPVYDFTNRLNRIWTTDSPSIMQKLNYCCGNLHKFGPQLLFCHGTTQEKYCQIPIGAKYKCYQDQYSFCIPCFKKIDKDFIDIHEISSETTRGMNLPKQPVPKSDFKDCANDNWQYETFIECTQCHRRVHQICELYPARQDQIKNCIQHQKLEEDQKLLSKIPNLEQDDDDDDDESERQESVREVKNVDQDDDDDDIVEIKCVNNSSKIESNQDQDMCRNNNNNDESKIVKQSQSITRTQRSLNNLQFMTPEFKSSDITKSSFDFDDSDDCTAQKLHNQSPDIIRQMTKKELSDDSTRGSTSFLNIFDDEDPRERRDNFLCNYCYRKDKIGLKLRHRKYSARRLPHTRMSRYIETKVNEYIKENAPSTGEVTVRVLTAYRDNVVVKPEMSTFIKKCRNNEANDQHPNLHNYPDGFNFTNRAIFAWQEIDGVDVCVFGMHVQEYGDDCPEPNRQVVYLSYLDSVHFFRPKTVRTAVYHEILLSYFKYVRRLGFRQIFIWVSPSRKGDDYIFYRHPTEQKMPTLRRLADWYINLLDKGIMNGIIDRHETLHQFFTSSRGNSLLSMPYLNGDYWPGEFERLLKIMFESQKEYDIKMQQLEKRDKEEVLSECTETTSLLSDFSANSPSIRAYEKVQSTFNSPPFMNLPNNNPTLNLALLGFLASSSQPVANTNFLDQSFNNLKQEHTPLHFTPGTMMCHGDQPLDLSKSSSHPSPASHDDDYSSDYSFLTNYMNNNNNNINININNNSGRKRKRKNTNLGYTKKRTRATTQTTINHDKQQACTSFDASRFGSQNLTPRSSHQRSCTQLSKESATPETIITPYEGLIRNLDKSLKRQKEGFMVARLNDCDCSPHFESQRRKEETLFTCNLMKGREPFLQLARLKNYEFSTLRRAKFSSLAMVKHLGRIFKLDPICHECFSFDSSKCHFACDECDDYYLCTSCHENTQHEHDMTLLEPTTLPDIQDFLQDCSNISMSGSISSASSIISNKSFNESSFDMSSTKSITPICGHDLKSDSQPIHSTLLSKSNIIEGVNMPLSCHTRRNQVDTIISAKPTSRSDDEENANMLCSKELNKLHNNSSNPSQLPQTQPTNPINCLEQTQIGLDSTLVNNFIRQAEIAYDVDFDQMRNESKKLLSHYHNCPIKDACHQCRFVILSCSFMGIVMRSSSTQMLMNTPISMNSDSLNLNNHEINLSKGHESIHQNINKHYHQHTRNN